MGLASRPLRAAQVAGLLFAATTCEGRCTRPQAEPVAASASSRGSGPCGASGEVTFFVASDTHFGFSPEVEERNLEAIRQMNAMQGAPWPEALGGVIGRPCGVLVTGDLTEDGKPEEWSKFVSAFGHRGGDGALALPVFETFGNHDKNTGSFVRDRIAERHGSTPYSVDWGPVHLVALGDGPSDEELRWLDRDLERAGPAARIVLYFHYPLEGRWSTGHWFGDGPHRDRLRERLEGKNVVGIFHGHDHAAGLYEWRGLDVYRTGSPKHSWRTYVVAEIGPETMKVASWDYQAKRWVAWHRKPTQGDGAETRWLDPRITP